MSDLPETMAFREFARHAGFKPGYVTQLRHAGRLVLTEDGKRVCVAPSLSLIAETRDPAKSAVTARHAAARSAEAVAATGGTVDEAREPAPTSFDLVEISHARRKAKALADKEEALARKALRDEQLELGQLLVAEDVEHALRDAVVSLRNTLEGLPATLAPQLAALQDEAKVRVTLLDAFEHAMEELARKFAAIARSGVAA